MISINIHKKLHGSNGDMPLAINLNIKEGDFVALAGESGSGKTTLLRILAGLEDSTGTLKIGDEILFKSGLKHPDCFILDSLVGDSSIYSTVILT